MTNVENSTETTVTITRRSRNIGYGWNTKTEQVHTASGDSYLRVCPVTRPAVTGSVKTVLAERANAKRVTSGGTYWTEALFVGGRLVDTTLHMDVAHILDEVREYGACEVTLAR